MELNNIKTKKCPVCGEIKILSEFGFYFSKERNKYRPQNYCLICQKPIKRQRSLGYYQKNKEGRKEYAKKYRSNPENKDKLKSISNKKKRQYRENLQNCYVVDYACQKLGMNAEEVRKTEGLIEAYRAKIKLIRKIRQIKKNEKQIK